MVNDDRRQQFEEMLLGLVHLPWFRHGYMPNWLRLHLISVLSPGTREADQAGNR